MHTISPSTLDHISKKISLIGMAADTVKAESSTGNTKALTAARWDLIASESDYSKAMSELDPDQRAQVETLFADAIEMARAGRGGYTQAVCKAQIKCSDDQIRELETLTAKLKDARTEWVQEALSYDVTAYQVAKICDRTPSTVQRWVNSPS